MVAKPVKNASSLLLFSGHSEIETGQKGSDWLEPKLIVELHILDTLMMDNYDM